MSLTTENLAGRSNHCLLKDEEGCKKEESCKGEDDDGGLDLLLLDLVPDQGGRLHLQAACPPLFNPHLNHQLFLSAFQF